MTDRRWSIEAELLALGMVAALPLAAIVTYAAWVAFAVEAQAPMAHGVYTVAKPFAIIALLVATLVTSLVISMGLWYARRLARPINALIGAVRVAAGGVSAPLQEGGGPREIGVLVREFNRLLEARARAEQDASAKDRLLRDFFHYAPVPMVLRDRNAALIMANPRAHEVLGYPELGPADVPAEEHGGLGVALEASIRRVLRTAQPETIEVRRLGPNGQIREYITSRFPVHDTGGGVVGAASIVIDVTEQNAVLRAMSESEHRLRRFMDGLPFAVALTTPEGIVLEMNQAALKPAGLGLSSVRGLHLTETPYCGTNPTTMACLAAAMQRAVAGERVRNDAVVYLGTRTTPVDLMVAPIHDSQGRVVNLVVSASDIEERKRAEQEALARERRLSAQNIALAGLSRSDLIERAGLDAALKEILEVATAALDVQRTGIWLFDAKHEALHCHGIYVRERGHACGGHIATKDHPDYFAAVDSDRILAIADTRSSTIVASMAADYLLPLQIGAMLDAPIVKLGRRVGVLCSEHCGSARTWHPDEEAFAMLAADFVGIAIEADERLKAQRALELNSQKLSALSRSLLQAQEAERRVVARELHDEIGQALTAVKIHLGVVERERDPERRELALSEARDVVDHAIVQVRDKALDLRPSMLDDLGLMPALRWYLERFERRTGIHVDLHASAGERLASAQQETVCYRTIQEALTNVARYAEASRVQVTLERSEQNLTISVRDDGRGFDMAEVRERARRGEALGIAGMEERVRLVDGRLVIRSAPGAGTEVEVTFPVAEELA